MPITNTTGDDPANPPENGEEAESAQVRSHVDVIILQVLELTQQGPRGIELAGRMLHRNLYGWMTRYFVRHRVPEATAEELTNDVWLKVLTHPHPGLVRPAAWVRTIARNVLIDWVRMQSAEMRGNDVTVALDSDAWSTLLETAGSGKPPAWVRLCIERAAWQMEQDDPVRFELLAMIVDGWETRDIAIYEGADPENISVKILGAIRDRVDQVRIKARSYFAECKE